MSQGYDEGDPCPRCTVGRLEIHMSGSCICSATKAPCPPCEGSTLRCNRPDCEWMPGDPIPETVFGIPRVRFDELLALARAATPGPWRHRDGTENGMGHWVDAPGVVVGQTVAGDVPQQILEDGDYPTKEGDAKYIAALNPWEVIDLIQRIIQASFLIPSSNWLIWSNEHRAWWRPNGQGYTSDVNQAGRYSLKQAYSICRVSSPRSGNWHNDSHRVPSEVMVPSPEVLAGWAQESAAARSTFI